MTSNHALRWLYLKTGIVSALVALTVSLGVNFAWGSAFAAAALFGLLNWFYVGRIVLAITANPVRKGQALVLFCQKLFLLGFYAFVILPQSGLQLSAFLCGFMMFLIVAVLEAAGQLLSGYLQAHPGERPMPRDLKSLFAGAHHNG